MVPSVAGIEQIQWPPHAFDLLDPNEPPISPIKGVSGVAKKEEFSLLQNAAVLPARQRRAATVSRPSGRLRPVIDPQARP